MKNKSGILSVLLLIVVLFSAFSSLVFADDVDAVKALLGSQMDENEKNWYLESGKYPKKIKEESFDDGLVLTIYTVDLWDLNNVATADNYVKAANEKGSFAYAYFGEKITVVNQLGKNLINGDFSYDKGPAFISDFYNSGAKVEISGRKYDVERVVCVSDKKTFGEYITFYKTSGGTVVKVYDTVFAAASVYTDAEFASCAKTYSTYLKNLSDGEEKKNFNTYVKDEKLLEKLNKDDPYYNVDVDDVLKSNKLSNKEILLIALLSVAAITALTVCVILFVKKLSKRTDSKGK